MTSPSTSESASNPDEGNKDPEDIAVLEYRDVPSGIREKLDLSLSRRKGSRVLRVLGPFTPILLILFWEYASRSGLVDQRFFPAPSSIVQSFTVLAGSGLLWTHTAATLTRIVIGFTCGAVPAIVLGVLLGSVAPLRILLEPVLSCLLPIPKIAIYPLLMLIFGLGETSKYLIVAIGVFFTIFFNTMGGVLQTPQLLFDVGKANGANRWQRWAGIALPSALPSLFTGLKLAVGGSFVVIAASEYVGSQSGLGYLIWSAWSSFSVPKMYVGIVTISLLGYLATSLVSVVERLVIPWARR